MTFWVAAVSSASAQASPPAVRVLDRRLADTLSAAASASPTLKATLDAIVASDVVVHVVPLEEGHRWCLGLLRFVTRAGGHRYLRVAVRPQLPRDLLVETLGHELHHAVEVARERSVVDEASFAAFLRVVGHRSGLAGSDRWFDTAAAREAGRRVRREVFGAQTVTTAGSP